MVCLSMVYDVSRVCNVMCMCACAQEVERRKEGTGGKSGGGIGKGG